jgi:hypothetical protein
MRAIVQDRFGPPDVLELREIDRPQAGNDAEAGEAVVRAGRGRRAGASSPRRPPSSAMRQLGEGHAQGKLVITV